MHAWDCLCGIRNHPTLAVCRACGAPSSSGRVVPVETTQAFAAPSDQTVYSQAAQVNPYRQPCYPYIPPPVTQAKWYHDPLAIVLLYFFLWPISIFAVMSHPLWTGRAKGLALFVMFAVPAACWGGVGLLLLNNGLNSVIEQRDRERSGLDGATPGNAGTQQELGSDSLGHDPLPPTYDSHGHLDFSSPRGDTRPAEMHVITMQSPLPAAYRTVVPQPQPQTHRQQITPGSTPQNSIPIVPVYTGYSPPPSTRPAIPQQPVVGVGGCRAPAAGKGGGWNGAEVERLQQLERLHRQEAQQ